MLKNHFIVYKYILLLIFAFLICITYDNSFAEESTNNPDQSEQINAPEIGLEKRTINFADGAWGFVLNNFWQIHEGELQFIPKGENKSFLYHNIISGYYLPDYMISVKTRWISGSDYSYHGLIFKYLNPKSYYMLAVSLNGDVVVTKYYKNKWKTIKTIKNRSNTNIYDSLKVICEGSSIKCFINEKKICEFKDKTIYNTSFGVCSDGNIKSGFKEFTIEELSASK